MAGEIDLDHAKDSALAAYEARGGKHPAFALFYYKPDWEAHIGNGICPAVALGEVPGEVVGCGATARGAIANLMLKLDAWRVSP